MASPFKRTCDRCGERFHSDKEVFRVSYETLGYYDLEAKKPEGSHIWRTLELCDHCQRELRNEFYRRGMMKHDC